MLHVLLDATAIPADRGGVGRYVDELVRGLARRGDLELSVAARPDDVAHFAAAGARAVPVAGLCGRGARLAWEQTGFVRLVRRHRPDVLHSPHYTFPLRAGVPTVVTVHDATFFSHPQWHSRAKGPFFRAWTRIAARRAAGIITPSEATRDELQRRVRIDPAAVTVAPLGVDRDVFHVPSAGEQAALRAELNLDGPFVAFLGTLEPRKNVTGLIGGWVAAVRDRPDAPALVLAGGRGWDAALNAALADVPAGLRVVRTGYLPIGLLAPLLGAATVVAYPSHGEGFGLPVAEAMSCGACVLTTRNLALPEVGGDAVAYSGTSAPEIAVALRALLAGPATRTDLRARALARAAGFSWDVTAARHVEAYRRAAS